LDRVAGSQDSGLTSRRNPLDQLESPPKDHSESAQHTLSRAAGRNP
jgi:hypothetical protein